MGLDIEATSSRKAALAPFFAACDDIDSPVRTPGIPSLSELCMGLILALCGDADPTDFEDLVLHIPLHLRRALMRYAAVHSPLNTDALAVLCVRHEQEEGQDQGWGSVEGELVVVEPQAALRRSWSRDTDQDRRPWATALSRPNGDNGDASGAGANAIDSTHDRETRTWDDSSSDTEPPPPLVSLALVGVLMSAQDLVALPRTLTRLALVQSLPKRGWLKWLPTVCPALVFLDLSYNPWLADIGVADVEWWRMRYLRVLVLRGLDAVSPSFLVALNRERWEDVSLIL